LLKICYTEYSPLPPFDCRLLLRLLKARSPPAIQCILRYGDNAGENQTNEFDCTYTLYRIFSRLSKNLYRLISARIMWAYCNLLKYKDSFVVFQLIIYYLPLAFLIIIFSVAGKICPDFKNYIIQLYFCHNVGLFFGIWYILVSDLIQSI
jgi:hypothetical protein